MQLVRWFLWMILLAIACISIGSAAVVWLGFQNDLRSWILAAGVNLIGGGLIGLLLIQPQSPWAMTAIPITISLWRVLAVLTAVVVARATKWPNYYFFVGCLLGCYFPFLVLESSLSIWRASKFIKPSKQRG